MKSISKIALRRATTAALNFTAHFLGKPPVLDPDSPAFRKNPYLFYRRLRERDPVHWHPLGIWLVTRYADALKVWTDPRFAHPPYEENARKENDPFELMRSKLFISRNPPDHTWLRKIFTEIFTKGFVDSLRPRIQEMTDELLAPTAGKNSMDVVKDLAQPLPSMVIMEILGLPARDRTMLMKWSNAVVNAMGVAPTTEERARGAEAAMSFGKYFRARIDELRKQPGTDVISKLLAAQTKNPVFTDDEIIANTALLFAAGHETTVSLLGCGLLSLLRNPDQLSKLRSNPSLMGSAIDEFLRYEAPIQFFGRMAMEDLTLGGKQIKKGQTVFIVVGAVNRDPEQFPDPERLNIERARNNHLTFGHGIHTCIGQYLARAEGAIALGTLLKRFPTLRLTGTPQWRDAMGGRCLESLRVRFD